PPPGGPHPPDAGPSRAGGRPPRTPRRPVGAAPEPPPPSGVRRVFRVPVRTRPPVRGTPRTGGAETSSRTAQTVLLALSGLLLGGAAVVLTFVGFPNVATPARIGLLAVVTPVMLALPVQMARRGLVSTAETVAAVGLLLVLLDGYVAWKVNLVGVRALPSQFYAGLVCAATAGVATAYRAVSHLKAPRFATVIVLQPLLPLLACPLIVGSPTGWGLVFTGVAAMEVALAVGTSPIGPPKPSPAPAPAMAENGQNGDNGGPVSGPPRVGRTVLEATALLRESTW